MANYLKPVVTTPTPFDASDLYRFDFGYSGGDQFNYIQYIITSNTDVPTEIVNKTINSYAKYITIEPGTLTNGLSYTIKIRVGNNTDWSDYSSPTLFQCFTKPVVAITSLSDGVAGSQSYLLKGMYTQNEGDNLKSYIYNLYDNDGVLIDTSNELFDTALSYLVVGLKNETYYYAELICTSQNGVSATSGRIHFMAQYVQPLMHSMLDLSVLDNGNVRVDAILTQATGYGENYTFEDGWVNITEENSIVTFEEGMDALKDDFTLQLWLKGIEENKTLVKIHSSNGYITLIYYGKRFHVFKYSYTKTSHYINNIDIDVMALDEVYVGFRVINNQIDVVAKLL